MRGGVDKDTPKTVDEMTIDSKFTPHFMLFRMRKSAAGLDLRDWKKKPVSALVYGN